MLCLAETISAWPFLIERPHKILSAVLQLKEKRFNPLTGCGSTSGSDLGRHFHFCPSSGIRCMQPFLRRMHRNPGAAHFAAAMRRCGPTYPGASFLKECNDEDRLRGLNSL